MFWIEVYIKARLTDFVFKNALNSYICTEITTQNYLHVLIEVYIKVMLTDFVFETDLYSYIK